MSLPDEGEIVFVVDVTSFTEDGFIGTSRFMGDPVSVKFDGKDEGVFLTQGMAQRLSVSKASRVAVVVETERERTFEALVAGVGQDARISDSQIYLAVGSEGGGVVRIRRA